MRTSNNMMSGVPAVLAIVAMGLVFSPNHSAYANTRQSIDFRGIEAVIVHGEGSKVEFNAVNGAPGDLRILQGGWAPTMCDAQVEVNRSGSTLDIRLIRSGIRVFGQCDITLALDLPERLGLSLEQDRTVVQFGGTFADVRIKSDDAVVYFSGQARAFGIQSLRSAISFSGQATNLDISGDEATVDLAFKSSQGMKGVTIKVKKLVANIGFRSGTALSYAVNARMSHFDPNFPNTAAAPLKVEITSEELKGSLYILTDGAN